MAHLKLLRDLQKYEPHTDYSVMVYPVSVPKYWTFVMVTLFF